MHKIAERYSEFASPNASPDRNKIHFTDKSVKHLKPKEKREIYWFEGMIGFGVRVTPKGTKSFVYTYRFDGIQKMMTIGRYPKLSLAKAREEYSISASKYELGEDPAESKVLANIRERETPTVKELISQYLEYCISKRKKTWKEDQRVFEKDVIPVIGHIRINKVTKRHIRFILSDILNRGSPGMHDHTLVYLRHLFNVAEEWDYILSNPCKGIKKIKPRQSRQRVLSTKEIWKFWHGLDQCDLIPIVKLALKFTLCTYTRSGETINAMWDHFDPDSALWTIPESMTKNKQEHRIPLNGPAKNILKEIFPITGASDYVFGSTRHTKSKDIVLTDLKPLTKCALSQGLRLNRKRYIGIEKRFTPHDLRRTAATITVALGCPVDWAERLLNHTKGTLIQVYNRYSYDLEMRTGSDILGYALERIISCKTESEVPSLEILRKEINAKGLLYKHFSFIKPSKPILNKFEVNITDSITDQFITKWEAIIT